MRGRNMQIKTNKDLIKRRRTSKLTNKGQREENRKRNINLNRKSYLEKKRGKNYLKYVHPKLIINKQQIISLEGK